MEFSNAFTKMLNIRHPLVMAPMFLVSNVAMIKAGIDEGVLSCFPTLNYRTEEKLAEVLKELNEYLQNHPNVRGTYGVNVIVQKSNPWAEKHLAVCVEHKVPVLITSLGKPEEAIKAVHKYGGKVFCDVTNVTHAKKC